MGRKVDFAGFTSTTIDQNTASAYAATNGVVLVISTKNGKRLGPLSLYAEEKEVVLHAFSFDVRSLVHSTYHKYYITQLHLQRPCVKACVLYHFVEKGKVCPQLLFLENIWNNLKLEAHSHPLTFLLKRMRNPNDTKQCVCVLSMLVTMLGSEFNRWSFCPIRNFWSRCMEICSGIMGVK